MLNTSSSSVHIAESTAGKSTAKIERKEYQTMLLNGSLAFSAPSSGGEFDSSFTEATASRKQFALMLMRENDGDQVEQMLLYMFEAEQHICAKVSPKLQGLASGYLITLWSTVNDDLLKDKIGRGLTSLHSKGLIDDSQLFSPQEFSEDKMTQKSLYELIERYSH